jgi:hypothetical protein
MVPKGRNLRQVPMVPKSRNLKQEPMGSGYQITPKNPRVWVGLDLSLNSMGIFGLGTQRGL